MVPPYLGCYRPFGQSFGYSKDLTKNPVGDATGERDSQPHSWGTTRLYGFIPFALVTAANPAQAISPLLRQTQDQGFDWQLGGPFSAGVRTGITPSPGSLNVVSTLTLPRQRF